MRLPALPASASRAQAMPLWPPLLATRGPGGASGLHAHHALHFVLAVEGELRACEGQAGSKTAWQRGAGVLTAPDVMHSVDALGREVVLVFLDPESELGGALAERLAGGLRMLSAAERSALVPLAEPLDLMRAGSGEFGLRAAELLGARTPPAARALHPRVRKLLRLLQTDSEPDVRLEALAEAVGLSPGRLMHVFTESIGIPLRPYVAWLKLQRAAGAIASGAPLTQAAQGAGFADAAHMSRTFRRMLGASPSELKPRSEAVVRRIKT